MRDNPKRDELDFTDDVRRCCKKNSPSVLFCIGMETKEGCDLDSKVGIVHSEQNGDGTAATPIPPLTLPPLDYLCPLRHLGLITNI